MNINYRQMPSYISGLTEYQHGSSHAVWSGNTYQVYSYSTLMLEVTDHVVTYFNDDYYSSTTSRLQNIIRRSFPSDIDRYLKQKQNIVLPEVEVIAEV